MPHWKSPLKKIWESSQISSFSTLINEFPGKTEGVKSYQKPRSLSSPVMEHLNSICVKDHSDYDSQMYFEELKTHDTERIYCKGSRNKAIDEFTEAQTRDSNSLSELSDRITQTNGKIEASSLFRSLSMNMSKSWTHENRILFKDIDFKKMEGEIVTFRARIHKIRRLSAKMVFIVFRQQTITIQGILKSFRQPENLKGVNEKNYFGLIPEEMVRCVEHYLSETIVIVRAGLRRAVNRVNNTTIHDYEFDIHEVHKVGDFTRSVPFTVYDAENIDKSLDDDEEELSPNTLGIDGNSTASPVNFILSDCHDFLKNRSPQTLVSKQKSINNSTVRIENVSRVNHKAKQKQVPQKVRLKNRIVDLRTGPSQAIFRIQSGICNLFRSYLDSKDFIEIHTPKIQGGATESGASVFELNYFGRPAFLAQSPQLAKQMCIAADFERVYEIGPVFRAENSNTPRHLTEFTGLDLEMAFEEHYHEALDIIDGMFKNLWHELYHRFENEINLVSRFYRHEKIQWLEETPRIPFCEAIKMLREDDWTDDKGNPPLELEDLTTRAEIRLGELVKKKYKADYYIVDKFPMLARPFYTMPDPSDGRFTNSFDIFLRGQEILSGGQRIHDAIFLEKRMKKMGVKPNSMQEYLSGFLWGAPPHAGCGIGLERLTFLFLNLGNIRLASLFPRDPKLLPAKTNKFKLRYDEASTVNPPWRDKNADKVYSLQPLEKLIANYGDAANTSWLDEEYHVWRHPASGAAQGYVISNGHAIIIGEPLCDRSQYHQIISAFLKFTREQQVLKPIWIIAGPATEEILGVKYSWRTVGCIAEERIDPRDNSATKNKDLARKLRHAHNEGIKESCLPSDPSICEDLRTRIDERIHEWYSQRKGTQVHLTKIRPWVDQDHRSYFYAQTRDGVIQAFVVLHCLSPKNGYQIKFSLEFPGAPSGTIESLIFYSMKAIIVDDPEVEQLTYGTSAMPMLNGGRNLGRLKTKALKKIYEKLYNQLNLNNKSDFRGKMGVRSDPVYICYPSGGLGLSGIKAIMDFLEKE